MGKKGFTIIELLVVIAIIGLLASFGMSNLIRARAKGKAAKAISELDAIRTAAELYVSDNGDYPPDVDRDIPPGIESYLAPGQWPEGPWNGSVYDWDNWNDGEIIQVTLRMCPISGTCNPPFKDWTRYSSMYYCITGNCVPHESYPDDPGWCVNCPGSKMPDLN